MSILYSWQWPHKGLKLHLTIAPRPVSKHASSSHVHNTRPLGGGAAPRGWWHMASIAMTRTQTIFCFSVREPDTALSPLAIHFESVQISVFCYIFVIVDRSKANT